MRDVVFIGDDITALGFRLAGIETHSPEPDALGAVVADFRGAAQLLMMTPDAFAALPPRLAQELADSEMPLLAIIPDARGNIPIPDTEQDVKRALGIET
jgi:vacuolar-type H+-ATPase subunit F/Vma7